LRQLFVQAVRQAQAGNIALTRLQPNHLAEILRLIPDDFPLPEGFAGQLFQETEGNPFFVVEYLNSIQRNQGLTESGYWKMPRSIRDLLSARIQDAGEVNQQLLSAAAVLGRSFDFLMLREVSGRSEMEIVSGLEALMQRGLIIEDRTRDITPNPSYDFTHEKIRTLAYEQTSAARRILLHKRAADAFAARQRQRQSAALAAYHYQLAGQTNQAAEFFQLAGDYARAVYANREAIGHYQNALASGHSNPAALHESIGDLQSLSGEYLAALNSYEAAAARCEPESLGRIEHRLGVVHHLRGDWELAECHFQAALESPEITEATDLQARILADWSRTAYRRGEAQRALSLAERSLHLAEASQNQRALAQAQNILGILARQAGKTEAAIHHLQRSLEMATSLGEPGMQAAALNNLARAHAGCGELHTAIQLTQAALELCQQQGDRHRAAALHNNLADLYHAAGDTLSAQEQLKQAVVLFTEIGLQAGEPKPEIWMLTEW
jgi:tetratricopeptide (TPR) repeat protein